MGKGIVCIAECSILVLCYGDTFQNMMKIFNTKMEK